MHRAGTPSFVILLAATAFAVGCGGAPAASTPADAGIEDVAAAVDASDGALPGDAAEDPVPLQTGLEVQTADGRIRGASQGGLRVFKGVPFAQAPVGDLRLRPPRPNAPWGEVLEATAFGPSCMQEQIPGLTGPVSEDCLTLNVWGHSDGTARPIMVWIYGGSFVSGGGGWSVYDGARLAEAADVVVVTLNYRLGPLGYLALPALKAEEPTGAVGNYGLLDQIQALRWIKRNAPAFGGDPSRVTVFGESAGAMSTCSLVGSELADDLFQRAIVQSGGCHMVARLDERAGLYPPAYATGDTFLVRLGCAAAPDAAACLRSRTAADFVVTIAEASSGDASFAPTIDGVVLAETPFERIRRGAVPERPMILGSNANEGALFTMSDVILTRPDLRAAFLAMVGDETLADALMGIYSALDFPVPKSAYDAFLGELFFNCNSYHAAKALAAPAYSYYLTLAPLVMSTAWGPLHGTDIFYTFGNFTAAGILPSVLDLATRDLVQGAWGSFAHGSAPTVTGLSWPEITPSDPRFLVIGPLPRVDQTFRDGRCDELRTLGLLP